MTTSAYFNHTEYQGEIDLYDSIVVESIQITGFDVKYIRRSDFVIDPILYEPKASVFDDAFTIEANIPDNLMNWQGDGIIMNQFGINVQNSGNILFSKTRWEQIMTERAKEGKTVIDRPLEGDLIYFGYGYKKYNNTLFIINQVDFSDMNWQLGRNFVFRCNCTLYTPSHNERVQTTFADIPQQISDALSGDDIIRQNENLEAITSTMREFSEENPLGGW